MKIKNMIKKNIFGFIIGTIFFGTITTVLAANIASSTITYTNSRNTSVTNVSGALQDLYQKIFSARIGCYNGVCGKITYRYWNKNFSGGTYSSNLPTSTYNSRETLESNYNQFESHPYYIKSILIDGSVVGHQACVYYENMEFCISPGYWVGELSSTASPDARFITLSTLQHDMSYYTRHNPIELANTNAVGVAISSGNVAHLCLSASNGTVGCGYGTYHCDVSISGITETASCSVGGNLLPYPTGGNQLP